MNKKNIIILATAATIFGGAAVTVVGAEQNQINEELASANGLEYRYKIVGEEKAYESLNEMIEAQNMELEPKNTEMADFITANKYTVDQSLVDGHTPYQINQYYASVIDENYPQAANKLITDIEAIYETNKDLKFNETEKIAYDEAKKAFDTLKVFEATTTEEKMQHITDLQVNKTAIDKVLADYNARTKAEKAKADSKKEAEAEAETSGGEVVYDEKAGTYEVSYENGGTPPASNSGSSGGSSNGGSSNNGNSGGGSGSSGGGSNGGSSGGSGGSSGGGSGSGGSDDGGSSSGDSCMSYVDWSNNPMGPVNDPVECITEDPYTGAMTVYNDNDICTWIHGMRSYMGASPVGCSAKSGTPGDSYKVGMDVLPSYEFVAKNPHLFPAMLAEPEEGMQKCFYVDFRNGCIYVDGYQI